MNKTTPRDVYKLLIVDYKANVNQVDEDCENPLRRYLVKQLPYSGYVIKLFIRAGFKFELLETKRFKVI